MSWLTLINPERVKGGLDFELLFLHPFLNKKPYQRFSADNFQCVSLQHRSIMQFDDCSYFSVCPLRHPPSFCLNLPWVNVRIDSITHCCFFSFPAFTFYHPEVTTRVFQRNVWPRGTFSTLVASFCQCSHASSIRRGQNWNETPPRNKRNFAFLTPFILLHPKHPMAVNCLGSSLAAKANPSPWFEMWRGKNQILGLQGLWDVTHHHCVPR